MYNKKKIRQFLYERCSVSGKSEKSLNRRKFVKQSLYGAIGTAISPAVLLSGCSKRSSGKSPNIFLITTDTLRADHLGCYGYRRDTSPNIDAFAKDAMLFENCFSHAADTRYSFASLLSGFLPHETGILFNANLPSSVVTLPQMLKKRGYSTMAVMSNYVMQKKRGFANGFDVYEDSMSDREANRFAPEKTASNATDSAIDLLKKYEGNRLFMWVHYQDPHGPYTPPDPYHGMFVDPDREPRRVKMNSSLSGRGGIPAYQRLKGHDDFNYYVSQYDAEIKYHDNQFKRLIDQIKAQGMYDNSLIIFSSDHGEGMGDHDYFFAHGEYIYNGQIHIPLIVKLSDQLSGRRKDFVQHLDIVPTVLDVAGIETVANLRGTDLRKVNNDKEIFSEMKSPFVEDKVKYALIYKGFKLIYTPHYNRFELYDLISDFAERTDLIADDTHLQRTNELKHRMFRICREDFLKIRNNRPVPQLDADELKKLKSLGYVQ